MQQIWAKMQEIEELDKLQDRARRLKNWGTLKWQ